MSVRSSLFMTKGKDPDPDPYLSHTDPTDTDPEHWLPIKITTNTRLCSMSESRQKYRII
jgi:hypothetical protein